MTEIKNITILICIALCISISCKKEDDINHSDAQLQKKYDSIIQIITHESNKDTVIELFKKHESIQLFKQNKKLKLDFLFQKANTLYKNNNYSEALKLYKSIISDAEKSNYLLMKGKCLERVASLQLSINNGPLALKYYYESLKIFENIQDKKGIAKVYNILGIYKGEYQQYDSAFYYLHKSLNIHKKLKDSSNIVQNRGNIAYVLDLKGEKNQAIKIYMDLINELEKKNDNEYLPVIYYNLSNILYKSGDTKHSLEYLKKSIFISETTRDTALLADLYLDYGSRLNKELSYQFYKKSEFFSKKIDNHKTELKALNQLVKIDSFHNQFQASFIKQSRIIFLQNAIFKNELENNVKISELKYNNFNNKKIIENQYVRLKNNQLLFLLIAIFITASILITIIIFKNRNKRIVNLHNALLLQENEIKLQKEKLHQHQLNEENQQLIHKQKETEIKLKENELIRLANQFEISNGILEHIYNELKTDSYKDKKYDIKHYKGKINDLIEFISQKQKEIKSPELFNTKFNQVHPEFFEYLKREHPMLSIHDIKLCAYIKINMSNKQIATILNITHDGILKARYRLRKKLHLDKSVSLEQYINKIVNS